LLLSIIIGCGLSREKSSKLIYKYIILKNEVRAFVTKELYIVSQKSDNILTFEFNIHAHMKRKKLGTNTKWDFMYRLISADCLKVLNEKQLSSVGFGKRRSCECKITEKGKQFFTIFGNNLIVNLFEISNFTVTNIKESIGTSKIVFFYKI